MSSFGEHRRDAALKEYDAVVAQFGALTEIRFKLLAFLPLGTIATVVLAKDSLPVREPAVALFGLIVTVCLAVYNKRNDQHYDELVGRAAELEREFGLHGGSFANRPTTYVRFGPIAVEHRWPIGLVYAASSALWAHLLVHGLGLPRAVAAVAAALVIAAWFALRASEKDRRSQLRSAVKSLKDDAAQLLKLELASSAEQVAIDGLARKIAGETPLHCDEQTTKERVAFQCKAIKSAPRDHHDYVEASYLVAAAIDLPARWIYDMWSGRR